MPFLPPNQQRQSTEGKPAGLAKMAIISNRCQTAKRLTESDLWRDAVRTIDSADLPTKAYLSAITVTNISKSFYLQDGGKNQLA